jgi:hypothetical protein
MLAANALGSGRQYPAMQTFDARAATRRGAAKNSIIVEVANSYHNRVLPTDNSLS